MMLQGQSRLSDSLAGFQQHSLLLPRRVPQSRPLRVPGSKQAASCRHCFKSATHVVRATADSQAPPADPQQQQEQQESSNAGGSGNWIPVLKPEDLPKGIRKEVKVEGIGVLVFWYRNALYAIENRSPAEGAYSEGFADAKFTQDFGIICPSTSSVFSLKDGEILEWYPNNPVLRTLTPRDTCRPLDIYPVKLTQDAIMVDISDAATTRAYASTRGGSDSSAERNNVYALQPKSYIQGQSPDPFGAQETESGEDTAAQIATLTVAILAVGSAAVAGTAVALYKESVIGLVAFWVLLFAGSALFVIQYRNAQERQQ